MRRIFILGLLAWIHLTLEVPSIGSADGESEYKLPFPKGTRYICTQGNGGTFSHTGKARYAWDFAMPDGAPVVAARGGVVKIVKDWNRAGGGPGTANVVVIDHGDDTEGLYMHLQHKSAVVSYGQRVQRGQMIARAGATGYATGPHLHFQVQRTSRIYYGQSIPISFADAGVPVAGRLYTSDNEYIPTPVDEPYLVSTNPTLYRLHQSFPNPFNAVTTIKYQLPERTRVQLWIYNVLGERIRTLIDEVQEAGYYSVMWDGRDDGGQEVASGVYLCGMRGGEFTDVRKMTLVR